MKLNVKELVDKKFPSADTRTEKANRNKFAKAIGVSFQAACKIYEGETVSIKFDTLEAICRALECTPNEIISFEDPQLERLRAYQEKLYINNKDDAE